MIQRIMYVTFSPAMGLGLKQSKTWKSTREASIEDQFAAKFSFETGMTFSKS
jgi:hypothetical protein